MRFVHKLPSMKQRSVPLFTLLVSRDLLDLGLLVQVGIWPVFLDSLISLDLRSIFVLAMHRLMLFRSLNP